jgi:hypothetical protein
VSVLEVFVNEPTLDWQQHARKVAKSTFKHSEHESSQVSQSQAGSVDQVIDDFAKGNVRSA